jgi:hypothetical protein
MKFVVSFQVPTILKKYIKIPRVLENLLKTLNPFQMEFRISFVLLTKSFKTNFYKTFIEYKRKTHT